MNTAPKVAADLYAELQEAPTLLPDYGRAYQRLNQVFGRAVNMAIEHAEVNFPGMFARVDFLLKSRKAGKALTQRVNDTRVRLRMRAQLDEGELRRYFYYDLKTVAQTVQLLYGADPPRSLHGYFLEDDSLRRPTGRSIGEYLRAVVERVDEHYIHCRADAYRDGAELRVAYTHGNSAYRVDWSYLRQMLSPGMQINLIHPRCSSDKSVDTRGGTVSETIHAELIIVEPDQLVNVSTIASCFTNYAESYVVELLNRIQPQESTQATLLGNFAGQLLDEAIHRSERSYGDSIREFFRSNAMSMVGADIKSEEFHRDARNQKANIRAAIETALPWTLQAFDPGEGIVEPSFISEMLGLQGRMDFLQLDYKVLMEQKSGKGAYPYGDFVKPRQKEEHYVQMLLYMAIIRYNFREAYEANGRELHAFLLYSKYKESLLGLGFAPDLIYRAIRVRNELAWANVQYALHNGMRMLETLTSRQVNKKNDTGSLWRNHQQPRIEATLATIREASELERDYYFRYMGFLSSEYLMAKVGTSERECSGYASTWQESVDDKRQGGNIYDNLRLEQPAQGTRTRVDEVVLRFDETARCDMANFRKGDIVMLYPYAPGSEPDARRTMVLRSTVADIQPDTITLALRAPQSDSRVFDTHQGKLWAIEHDFMESSYSAIFKGMHALLSAPRSRRDLVLMQRRPAVDSGATVRGDYGGFNGMMQRVKQARDLFLIIGPPGTGKTSYGMLNTLKEELLENEIQSVSTGQAPRAVAVCSYTNRAVDEICSKLVEQGIDFIRLGSREGCDSEYTPYLLSVRAGSAPRLDDIRRMIGEARVFVGTTTAFNSNQQIFSLRRFSLAIVDEASQILEPHLMPLLSAKHGSESAISKFVLIGDHKQLPAVVHQQRYVSEVREPHLRQIGLEDCRQSLFERLLRRYGSDPSVTYMLRRQGRMHREIADFPNRAFYGGQLLVVPLPHQEAEMRAAGGHPALGRRVTFVDVPTPADSASEKVNVPEAEEIARLVLAVRRECGGAFDPGQSVGVIVPYRNQIATVRHAIERMAQADATVDDESLKALRQISIDTVERYQGSQRDNIIYGFTVQRPYQLDFLREHRFVDTDGSVIDRKLNVAMTRARERLILVGSAHLLGTDEIFAKLIDEYRCEAET